MPKDTTRIASKLYAVAIAAAGAGFAVAAPAQAGPGNCDQWTFSGVTNIKLSTGPMLSFEPGPSENVSNATATDGRQDWGTIEGTIQPNGFVMLVYTSKSFPDDPQLILRGDVTPDGKASGNFTAKQNGTWELTTPLTCKTPTAGGGAQGGGNSRAVTGDVDVYDTPGGAGSVIGMLRGGDHVNLGSGCRDDNWCNIAFPGGPGGTAWVWGDFLK